ncbi:serpin A12 [Microcebus murinus]|uniref:Serpin family A member 12 n=1 Tax=Microcebus murinus TaxID=30608 RepID=A0A8B7EIM5_MICMU|nr:serpin A12 [Microcebus murinus]XP_012594094.1 serpin A12 [Microcebus murinus]XP_012594095.1 serpin A12 [Microcebus murinus]
MNPTLGLSLFLAGLLTTEGLLKPSFSDQNHETLDRSQERKGRMAAKELAKRNMAFGFKLLKKMASVNSHKNIFFSPLSISTAFSLMCLGAQDDTLAEIKQGFNFRKMSDKDLHEGFHYLIRKVNQETQGVKVKLGNTLFMDKKLQPQREFLRDAKNLYYADTVPTNFQNMENARQQINDYISEKTHGKINNLVKNIDSGTVMLLTNYMFFRAKWQNEFDPKLTKEEAFILERNNSVKVPMMFHGGMYQVGRDDQLSCTILEIPYLKNITATFILPDEGKMKHLEEALEENIFAKWKPLMLHRVVDVSVPKLHITGTHDLKRTLSHLGITRIFEEHGDLSRISPHRSLKVGEAVHEAELKMDEKGTEGAAGSGAQTLPMETPMPVKINRPYILVVHETLTPSILFLGKIVNPTSK